MEEKKTEKVEKVKAASSNEDTPAWAKALAERIEDLSASMEAMAGRIDALESSSAAPAKNGKEATEDMSFASETAGLSKDSLDNWRLLQDKRAASAQSIKSVKIDAQRLEQVAREIEQQTITSVQSRLQNLKTAGKLADFKVIPPGSVGPAEHRSDRLLLTIDSNGFIISAQVG